MADRHESWIDKQIREAQERGDFDNLPGLSKPLPDRGEIYDEDWWLKDLIRRENLSGLLPPTLALRKEIEDVRHAVANIRDEAAVRALLADLNARIVRANGGLLEGPPVALEVVDAEEILRMWRHSRAA